MPRPGCPPGMRRRRCARAVPRPGRSRTAARRLPCGLPSRSSPSVATKVLRCSVGSPNERMALRVAWSAWVSTRVTKGLSLLSQTLDAPEAIAEPGRGQGRSLANQADGAAPRQGEQHVVGTVAIVVHAHGVVWCGSASAIMAATRWSTATASSRSASSRNHCLDTGYSIAANVPLGPSWLRLLR